MNNLNNVNANLNNLIPVHNNNNNNYGYVSNNDVRNVLRNIERQNVLEAQNADNLNLNMMNMNAAELAALENFAMSPGTPSHRNKRARFI
jgi:predicted transcriptional regulator